MTASTKLNTMVSGSDISRVFNPTSDTSGALNWISRGGLVNIDKGEPLRSPSIIGQKNICEPKALAALKRHSEAEKRRRKRINGHLATLRGLVPSTEEMDKATLLGEVISQIKELKKNAAEASKGFLIPMDTDEVKVEPCDDDEEGGYGSMSYKASVCCDYRPELLSELRKTLDALQLQLVRTELSILGDRVKNVFVYTCCSNIETCQLIASSVHQALSSVLDKASNSLEYSLRTSDPTKR